MRRYLLAAVLASLLLVPASAQAIVGGEPSTRDTPWMVALEEDGSFFCGGSLLAPTKVLTAAHCVSAGESDPSVPAAGPFQIRAGTKTREDGGTVVPVASIEIHERYQEPSGDSNDVALLTLARPVSLGTLRLADPATEKGLREPGDRALVLGWGSTTPLVGQLPSFTTQLQEVEVPIVGQEECGAPDAPTQICAGETNRDSCQGDSGGPLVVGDARGAPIQVGVVSTGFGCGVPDNPGIYASVGDTALFNWVNARVPQRSSGTGTGGGGSTGGGTGTAPAARPPIGVAGGSAPKRVRLRFGRRFARGDRIRLTCAVRNARLRRCTVRVRVVKRRLLRTIRTVRVKPGRAVFVRVPARHREFFLPATVRTSRGIRRTTQILER